MAGTGYEGIVDEARAFADEYADRFDHRTGEPVVLHGWFTPDHVAVADGEATCVVDFEHSLVGNAEWDYWRTAVPLFVNNAWERPADAEASFRTGYESVRPLPDSLKDRAVAYRALVTASYLDSLHAQRGIGDESREFADWLAAYSTDAFDALRTEWN